MCLGLSVSLRFDMGTSPRSSTCPALEHADNRLSAYHVCLQSMDAPVDLLPALLALLETESVTLAARRMRVGQPAMSRTLEKLRQATGDELLVRTGRKLVRTRRASEILPEARSLLSGAQRVLGPPSAFVPHTAQGVVTFALGDDMQAVLASHLLERMRAAAPGLDIRVRPLVLESAHEAVRGVVDLAVMPDLRGQVRIPMLDELVISAQYTRRFVTVTRKRKKLTLEAFLAAEHALVSPGGEEGGYVDDALRALGKRRRVAVTVPGFQAAITLVRELDLVATLPDDIVRVLAPRLHRQACPVSTPELPMCVAWARRFNQDARHRWLRELVSEVVRELGRGFPGRAE
ncbi:LysR family transcriptional regulator [Sorangium sp. So ce426]|uniref:LysR family transcriptional regulator n=1 Tax=Sorangium sp. So ce426 TaxID=3133312 RepID=UPI003F5B7AFB